MQYHINRQDIDDILNCVDDVLHTEGKIAEVKKRMEDRSYRRTGQPL